MVENLPDTNVGNIEYIRKKDASDAVIKHLQLDYEYAWGVREAINSLPSADVAPVVHAHWIRHENADVLEGYEVPMFECSKCRAWKEDDSDFCPDCGAKMDE